MRIGRYGALQEFLGMAWLLEGDNRCGAFLDEYENGRVDNCLNLTARYILIPGAYTSSACNLLNPEDSTAPKLQARRVRHLCLREQPAATEGIHPRLRETLGCVKSSVYFGVPIRASKFQRLEGQSRNLGFTLFWDCRAQVF